MPDTNPSFSTPSNYRTTNQALWRLQVHHLQNRHTDAYKEDLLRTLRLFFFLTLTTYWIDNLKEGRFIWAQGIRGFSLLSLLGWNVGETHSRGDGEERRWVERERKIWMWSLAGFLFSHFIPSGYLIQDGSSPPVTHLCRWPHKHPKVCFVKLPGDFQSNQMDNEID